MKLRYVLVLAALFAAGCHPGPVIDTGPDQPAGGTIAGIVSTEGKVPIAGRKVTAVNTSTNARYETTTGANGGYTVKVPEGTYRLELELQPGEKVVRHPGETRINKSDLDPGRHFVVSGAKTGAP